MQNFENFIKVQLKKFLHSSYKFLNPFPVIVTFEGMIY